MASVIDLIAHYELTEEDCKREVSDADIVKIASSVHGKWKSQLPPLLGMETIIVTDIVSAQGYIAEEDRRLAFFKEWKQRKGFDATYKTLISALLEISCRQDAESVCKILKETTSAAPPDQASTNATSIPSSSDSSEARSLTASILSPKNAQEEASTPTDATPSLAASDDHPKAASIAPIVTTSNNNVPSSQYLLSSDHYTGSLYSMVDY